MAPEMYSAANPEASSPFCLCSSKRSFSICPIYPFLASDDSQRTPPVAMNAFRTPGFANGNAGRPCMVSRSQAGMELVLLPASVIQFVNGFTMHTTDASNTSTSGKRKTKSHKNQREIGMAEISSLDEEGIVNNLLVSLNLKQLDTFNKATGDRDLVDRILLVFDLLLRKIAQYEESKEAFPSAIRQPNMKASNYYCRIKKFGLRKQRRSAMFLGWKWVISSCLGRKDYYLEIYSAGVISRAGVILPDLTSGSERLPVSLVNYVDDAKGPAYFTYTPTPKYIRPYSLSEPSLSCTCLGECQSGVVNCPCIQKNERFLPYSSLGVLLTYPALVHECGLKCACSSNCRNRMTQAGLKVRL